MAKSEVIYLSHCISEQTPSYGNRDAFVNKLNSSFNKGDKAETSNWFFSNNHFGTHVDLPRHFIAEGKTVSDYCAGFWLFNHVCCVEVFCDNAVLVDVNDIKNQNIGRDVDFLLIKTNYENHRGSEKYWNENPGIAPELAFYLKEKFTNLRAIGFDFISVTSFQHRSVGKQAHLALLGGDKPILPIEDMALSSIAASTHFEQVIVSPLRVTESNGAPVTIIAKIKI